MSIILTRLCSRTGIHEHWKAVEACICKLILKYTNTKYIGNLLNNYARKHTITYGLIYSRNQNSPYDIKKTFTRHWIIFHNLGSLNSNTDRKDRAMLKKIKSHLVWIKYTVVKKIYLLSKIVLRC